MSSYFKDIKTKELQELLFLLKFKLGLTFKDLGDSCISLTSFSLIFFFGVLLFKVSLLCKFPEFEGDFETKSKKKNYKKIFII